MLAAALGVAEPVEPTPTPDFDVVPPTDNAPLIEPLVSCALPPTVRPPCTLKLCSDALPPTCAVPLIEPLMLSRLPPTTSASDVEFSDEP